MTDPTYLKQAPALVIEQEEIEEAIKPFVFSYGGELYALRSINSFAIDDYATTLELLDEDMTKVFDVVAVDDRTRAALGAMGAPFLKRVFAAWMKSEGVTPGESESSDA